MWSSGLATLCTLFFLTTYSSDLAAQWTYTQVEAPTTPAPNGFLSVQTPTTCTDGSQTLPNNGFLKAATVVTVDTSVTNAGKCDSYLYGNYSSTALHAVNLIWYFLQYPSGVTSYARFWGPYPYSLSYDSRTPGNGSSGSLNEYGLSQQGQYQLGFQTNAIATGCNFPTDSPITWKPVNVLSCKPAWFVDPSNAINYHAPLGNITIKVPAGFGLAQAPAEAAAAAWSAALGRTIVVQADSTCPQTDPLCVDLKADHGTLDGDTGCASLGTASYNPAGEWTGSTAVRFMPDWSGAHPDKLQRLIAHELGHYFGLYNRLDASCGSSDTIMGAFTNSVAECYSSAAPATGTLLAPSGGDTLAIQKSTYGDHVRTMCGW